jgi:ATP-binding cassette subfamily B protein RaxB
MSEYQTTNDSMVNLLKFSGSKSIPLVMQAEVAECGLACLAMISTYYGYKVDMLSLRKRFNTNLAGINLKELVDLADNIGLSSRVLKCPLDEVNKLNIPCILHWDMTHFVVLTGVTKNYITINDPAIGKRRLTQEEFSKHYTGIAMENTPTQDFQILDERVRMRLSQLWGKIAGLKTVLINLFVLSVLLQFFALTTPYYMQWVVDEVLVSQDNPLLVVLAVGFSLMAVINIITTSVRGWLILRMSSLLSSQMSLNLLRHLLRLPMSYFENRHVGDILSRFGSLAQIRERITTGVVETIVDGLMSFIVMAMMMFYSVKLSIIVICAIVVYGLFRISVYKALQHATEENILSRALEQTSFLENVRAIQTIKIFNKEAQRQSLWQSRYSDVINTDIRLGKFNISFDAINKLIFSLENIIVIYLAATIVIAGDLTIGMVLAFLAYKNQLVERVSDVIEQLIQFRMLRLHLDRISDIALTKEEENREATKWLDKVQGQLVLENIYFSYSESEPEVIKNVSLTINAGEAVAIVGASGCGKTTLMKIMIGLLSPTKGRILLDGTDITQLGLIQYRDSISAVMQSDSLLSGSVADNITFFDPQPNLLKMQHCANLAAIAKDIESMGMGYNSLVGDMGSQFSGGQVQRLLLARALYKDPKIIFLDEATSHLDVDNEAKITEQINYLKMTRIIIAHRVETIKQADRILVLDKGEISHKKNFYNSYE